MLLTIGKISDNIKEIRNNFCFFSAYGFGIFPDMRPEEFRAVVHRCLAESSRSQHRVALDNHLPQDAIRSVLSGHVPRLDRAAEICQALDLEFYVGPPRPCEVPSEILETIGLSEGTSLSEVVQTIKQRIETGEAAGKLLQQAVREIYAIAQEEKAELEALLSDETATAVEGSPSRPVVTYELAAAAGGGAMELDETPTGIVYFRYDWLTQHGLDAKQCCVMGVVGESMETMLPDGCAILVNRRSGIRRRVDHLYVVINDLGLIVKRAGRAEDKQWLLVSDHPAWEPVPWGDAQMIGEVKWMARTL